MIITRTPFRISFFGGGTDYPTWYHEHGGAVLSTSFDKYSYISCRELPPFFDHKFRLAYSKIEQVMRLDDIQHPAIRAVLQKFGVSQGLELHCTADLPARSGLGSSSAFVVCLLHALHSLHGRMVSQESLFQEASHIEQHVLNEHVGSQDQVAAAMGGFNLIHFLKSGEIKIEPVIFQPGRKELLNNHLMLFFTGFSRIASEIAKDKIANMGQHVKELQAIRGMVDEALHLIAGKGDIRGFGELLHNSWMHKRALSELVSTPQIDAVYQTARDAGAIGGKILGAGGGGFILLFVEPEKQAAVRQALANLIHVPFRFESSGSQVIHYAA